MPPGEQGHVLDGSLERPHLKLIGPAQVGHRPVVDSSPTRSVGTSCRYITRAAVLVAEHLTAKRGQNIFKFTVGAASILQAFGDAVALKAGVGV